MTAQTGPENRDDHGLGIEVVDPTTMIKGTYIVERDAERLERRKRASTTYWVVATAALILLGEQSALSVVLYTPVLAKVAVEFQTAEVVWVLTTFTLAAAVLSPLMTKLGDVYGKRRILAVGAGVAAVGSLVCVLAPNFIVLLVGRGLMGTSAAFLPLTVAVMREVFPTRMRALAIGLATNGVGLMIVGGPLLAGWLTETWGVRSVFVFNFIICVVTPLIMLALVPETPHRIRSSVDYWSAALLALGVFGLLIGITQLPSLGLNSFTIFCLVLGALAAIAWWMRQSRVPNPLINVKLMQRRTILLPMVSFLVFNGVSYTMNYLFALHWAASPETGYGYGLSSVQIGLWSAAPGLLGVLAGVIVGLTSKSIGYRNHMILSGIFWVVPIVVLGLNLSAPPWFVIVMASMFGFANMHQTAAMCLILLAAPGDQRGVALGMKGAVAGVASGIISQLVFLILSASVVAMSNGVPVYGAGGFTRAYLVTGAIGLIGIVAALFTPQGRRMIREQRRASVHAEDAPVEPVGESAAPVSPVADGR